jgi:ferric-dicitrate binding protein FerR (iron transport regulator)
MAENLEPIDEEAQERFLLLVLRYLDGDLDVDESRELNELLRRDEAQRRRFMEFCHRACLIREISEPERQALLRREPAAAHAARASARSRSGERAANVPPGRRRKLRWLVAASLALVLTTALVGWWYLGSTEQESIIGSLEQVTGDVRVFGARGNARTVAAGAAIHSGDTIRTHGARSETVLVYADGTRLTLVGDTSVTCDGRDAKSVVAHQGTLAVSARPQPEVGPLILATPMAQLQVIGTRFLVEARADQTDLSVIEGRVRVTRVSDGKAVEVDRGKRLLAAERAELVVQNITQPPDTWELDFEDGLPGGTRGRWVADDLPRGSRGAVATRTVDPGDGTTLYEIATPENWYRGLFAVHADSRLHFTYRMDRPGWINVFVIARGPDPNGPHTGNYLFNQPVYPRPGGKWRTISIPLAKFQRAGTGTGPPPSADEIPYLVLFSASEDRGLVIDRLWVTRGGSGEVQVHEVE